MSWLVTNLSVFLSLPDAKPFSFQALAHIKLSSRPWNGATIFLIP